MIWLLAVVKVSLALVSTLQVVAADFLGEVVESPSLGSLGIDIVVKQPGHECEGGVQVFGSQAIDVEQGRANIGFHTVLHLLESDGLSTEVCDAFSSRVRREHGIHQ